ncbi:unnamed protein product [Hyaloperonospora brassicae]|uniref:Uncharacterized protein n=1 Tax=Hyaloperonospora brassicae TaxID=162125 RepID=A0AAV0TTR6_HYABA|nr:unnamed protein product [Hyaloperonospora brassicae]
MYQDRPVDVVKECYSRWGGIPRYVLRHATSKARQKELDATIAVSSFDAILRASVESSSAECDAVHLLLHFRVHPERFSHEGFDFASKYVAEKVFRLLYARHWVELMGFLAIPNQVGGRAVYRGALFERYAHAVLSQGGEFQGRRLVRGQKKGAEGGEHASKAEGVVGESEGAINNEEICVSLPARETVFFKRDEDVTDVDPSTYLQPASSNAILVDAMAKPNDMFQPTCERVHPCKQAGLVEALNLLGNPAAPRLYFVVPPDVYDDFTYQNCHGSGRKKVKHEDDTLDEVEQYVIKVNYAHEIRAAKKGDESRVRFVPRRKAMKVV